MLLGLVTDIHNHAAELARALELFRASGVEQVVTLGDTCDPFAAIRGEDDVVALLESAGAVGVWGNHDMVLCRDVSEKARETYSPAVLAFMETLRPRLVIADCHFSHEEASVDPFSLEEMWALRDEPLDLHQRARLGFSATGLRVQFVGHYHRWWGEGEYVPLGWVGPDPVTLAAGRRYFVVVAAVAHGWCALYDTATGLLRPMRCGVDS
jgi:predicted phosphodiesterase